MLTDIANILNCDSERLLGCRNVLLCETGCEASFLIHQLAALYLKGGQGICLVSFVQTFGHYRSVAAKLGVNFEQCRVNGTLVFLEGLKLLGQDVQKSCTVVKDNSIQETSRFFPSLSDSSEFMKQVYFRVKESLRELRLTSDQKFLVIIDDLSVFMYLGCAFKDIMGFYHYMTSFVHEMDNDYKRGCLMIKVHNESSVREESDEEVSQMENYLLYWSDLLLEARGLESGYSVDIDGELTVTWRDEIESKKAKTFTRKLHFKVQEKTVAYFPVGSSSAVLR